MERFGAGRLNRPRSCRNPSEQPSAAHFRERPLFPANSLEGVNQYIQGLNFKIAYLLHNGKLFIFFAVPKFVQEQRAELAVLSFCRRRRRRCRREGGLHEEHSRPTPHYDCVHVPPSPLSLSLSPHMKFVAALDG